MGASRDANAMSGTTHADGFKPAAGGGVPPRTVAKPEVPAPEAAKPNVPRRIQGPIPSLDGIRAVAVSIVFFAHCGLEGFVPGGLGVTIFFVLSGYLISTLMRIEHASAGAIRYRDFYLRRFLRLMPPLFVVVALTGLVSSFGLVAGDFSPGGLLSALFYYGNYYLIAHDFHGMPAGLGVLWSLAVEEHYYVFYPPLAALLLRIGRAGLSATVLSVLAAAVLGWRCWLYLHGASENYLTMATDTRLDAILIGCLMALWRNPWLDPVPAPHRLRDFAVMGGCLAILVVTLLDRTDAFRLTLRYTVQSLAIAPLIYLAVARAQQAPFRWLSWRAVSWLGVVSYSVYLCHHVIALAVAARLPQIGWLATTLITAALTLAVAEAMRRWVEQPCAALRKRLHRAPPVRGEEARSLAAAGAP
jgi:peptidoglycan/LPS O-acetylase OafA/YrhL